MIPANMRREFVTRDQLLSILREHGIDKISKVKGVYIEGSGHTSVVPAGDDEPVESSPPRKNRAI